MIISASRRTDIPCFYSKWLMNRLKEGYVLVPNPYNRKSLGRVELSPANVDCIVFWTKNPSPLIDQLNILDEMGYHYYFQFTLNAYGEDIERNLPPKEILMKTFIELSEKIGPERLVWRYDPIIIDEKYSIEWHISKFSQMAYALKKHTKRCVISFIDLYKSIGEKFRAVDKDQMELIAASFSQVAKRNELELFTCAEAVDLSKYGISHSSCIDKNLIENIIGKPISVKKDNSQRIACSCVKSIDIGVYNTCANGCIYCYASSNNKSVIKSIKTHNPMSPMLTGYPIGDEIIKERS